MSDLIPQTVTAEEAMDALHISRATLNRLVAIGRLRAYRPLPRKLLIDRRSLARLFDDSVCI